MPHHDDSEHPKRTYWHKPLRYSYNFELKAESKPREEANLVASLCDDGNHAPAIDLDFQAELIESKTPGHYHLYLNKAITWDAYKDVLRAMAGAGLIEIAFYEAALAEKKTLLRNPIVKETGQITWNDNP